MRGMQEPTNIVEAMVELVRTYAEFFASRETWRAKLGALVVPVLIVAGIVWLVVEQMSW